MVATGTFKQDMPRSGGYDPIQFARAMPNKGFSGYARFGIFIGVTSAAWVAFTFVRKRLIHEDREMMDARIAMEPLLVAERHRTYLKRLRENRDWEEELMKDVPGWVVGTFYGDPVFYNIRGRFKWESDQEYFMHNYWTKMVDRQHEKRKH